MMQRKANIMQPLNCSICLEGDGNDDDDGTMFTMKPFVSIGCRHDFHLECFEAYVVTRRQEDLVVRMRSCPVCRNQIDKVHYEGKTETVQQMLERCKWKAFKKTHGLKSKEEGVKLISKKIRELFEAGNFDKRIHDEHSIILKYLTDDIADDDMRNTADLRQLFATIAFFLFLNLFN